MRAVIQRVNKASVAIENTVISEIGQGFLILLGIEVDDDVEDVQWLANKISQLRVFSDVSGKMNNSLQDIDGEVIVVSQFTLHARVKKGSRPSYLNAAKADIAIPLYDHFKEELSSCLGKKIGSGRFGADMQVSLVNDGPVTIIIDTKNKQ